jgi:ribosome-binding protein aMBF1 (putative translation factor)
MEISRANYTIHTFAQQLNIKLKLLEAYVNGTEKPNKQMITKMNKYLNKKIPYD